MNPDFYGLSGHDNRLHHATAIASVWLLVFLITMYALVCAEPAHAADKPLAKPNPAFAPGAVNGDMTKERLCSKGFSTTSIRPSVSYTNRLKKMMMVRDHLPGKTGDYELDHLISLELGGAPADPRNLWMQPLQEARKKDVVESYLHREVCSGKMSLQEAQKAIVDDWPAIYSRLKGGE